MPVAFLDDFKLACCGKLIVTPIPQCPGTHIRSILFNLPTELSLSLHFVINLDLISGEQIARVIPWVESTSRDEALSFVDPNNLCIMVC